MRGCGLRGRGGKARALLCPPHSSEERVRTRWQDKDAAADGDLSKKETSQNPSTTKGAVASGTSRRYVDAFHLRSIALGAT